MRLRNIPSMCEICEIYVSGVSFMSVRLSSMIKWQRQTLHQILLQLGISNNQPKLIFSSKSSVGQEQSKREDFTFRTEL